MTSHDTNMETTLECVAQMADGVRENVLALQGLQSKYQTLFMDFVKEKSAIETKYDKLYAPIFARRKEIIMGTREPTDEEVAKGVESAEQAKAKEESKVEAIEDDEDDKAAASPAEEKEGEQKQVEEAEVGIPGFWLKALKNEETLAALIESCDEKPLSYLQDISYETMEEPQGFKLLFQFADNEYFPETTLTKTYFTTIDEEDGESLLVKTEGCSIPWKEGMNTTVTMKKKKQQSKTGKGVRTVEKEVPSKSFFTFFQSNNVEDEDMTSEIAEEIEEDFMTGCLLKEKVIPRAVAWYTGEAAIYAGLSGMLGGFGSDDENDEESGERKECKQQ